MRVTSKPHNFCSQCGSTMATVAVTKRFGFDIETGAQESKTTTVRVCSAVLNDPSVAQWFNYHDGGKDWVERGGRPEDVR